MYLSDLVRKRPRSTQAALVLVLLMSLLVTTACGGNVQIRQRASDSKLHFHQLLHHAYQLGLTEAVLMPLLKPAQQLDDTVAPFSPFDDTPINAYYIDRAQRYQHLQIQLQQLITSSTLHEHQLAQSDLRQTQSSLQAMITQGLPARNLLTLLPPLQQSLLQSHTFGDFATVVMHTAQVQGLLAELASTSGCLDKFKFIIGVMAESKLHVSTLQTAFSNDQARFAHINGADDVRQVYTSVDRHYHEAMLTATQAIPAIATSRINTLSQLIRQLPAYAVDATPYQQQLSTDQQLVRDQNMDWSHFQRFVVQIDGDIQQTQFALLSGETRLTVQQFHQDVHGWSGAHMYHDGYDGQEYAIDTSYQPDNFGNDADNLLRQARTVHQVQQALRRAEDLRFNHQLLEQDSVDATPYSQVHQTDLEALSHYHLQKGQVIVVSLAQQALRLYQDGNLVRSFLVTSGRNELPSPPGIWSVQDRRSPTKFHSSDPPGSPYWYPDTHINFAILFHDGGYFIHDSWWRDNYGPGTQFPHVDDSGDQHDSGNGSHGCVNLPVDDAGWIYQHTDWNTAIVVY